MSGLAIKHRRNFHLARWLVLLVILIFLSVYAYFGLRWYNTGIPSPLPLPVAAADASVDERSLTPEQIASHKVESSHPRYISIPMLGLSKARVVKTGLTPNNLLAMPSNIDDAGWFEKSVTPGSGSGAVVLTGHNGGVTRTGVFSKFHDLQAGDEIEIERGDGKIFTYQVRDVRNYSLQELDADRMKELMQSVDPDNEGLSLITSAGNWIPKQKLFDRRIVVRAAIAD